MKGSGDGMHSAALTATTTAPLPSGKIGEEPLLRFFPMVGRGGGGGGVDL